MNKAEADDILLVTSYDMFTGGKRFSENPTLLLGISLQYCFIFFKFQEAFQEA